MVHFGGTAAGVSMNPSQPAEMQSGLAVAAEGHGNASTVTMLPETYNMALADSGSSASFGMKAQSGERKGVDIVQEIRQLLSSEHSHMEILVRDIHTKLSDQVGRVESASAQGNQHQNVIMNINHLEDDRFLLGQFWPFFRATKASQEHPFSYSHGSENSL